MNLRLLIQSLSLLACCGFALAQPDDHRPQPPQIVSSTVLSTNGSTRATAYSMSNKIISADNKIFVAWLDRVADIMIKSYDLTSERWSETVLIGKGVDNHSGPAITMDGDGYLYVVFGPHHGPFQFTRSVEPFDISAWEPIAHFGVNATYPSLICDPQGMLHCTYRGGPDPRQLMYQQKPANGRWSEPVALVHPGVDSGYTQYGNPIAVSSNGVLHLGFHLYDMHPAGGKSIGYLRSTDHGKSWQNAGGQEIELPANPASPCFVEQGESLDMRIGTLALDPRGRPWFTVAHLERRPRTALLWHHDGTAWQSRDLLGEVQRLQPDWEVTYCSLAFDRDENLYIMAAVQQAGASTFWGHESLEIVLLTSSDFGENFACLPISTPDAQVSNWLPSIERPYGAAPIGVPSFLYTYGNRGEGLTDGEGTQVIFVRIGR